MELQFEKSAWPCLMTVAAQAKSEEQTQEIRLEDQMPDVGRVLAAWGQVLLRGKEWRSSGMTVSTGVMVWVLYAPEDGTEPRTVETWIPVQLKWDFPETKHDGTIIANCRLASVDARSVSARKLMVRAVISVFAEAVVPGAVDVWNPGSVPEDLQLLKRSYPVLLPREAGEKAFAMEETVTAPMGKWIRCSVQPEVVDTNVVAGKAVFRGICRFHVLYEDPEGMAHTYDQEFHFSQFADLDQDYAVDNQVRGVPAVTNLELEKDGTDQWAMKIGMVIQFVVSDRPMLEVVEDAYSLCRPVTVQQERLMLPVELEQRVHALRLEGQEAVEADRIIDTAFFCGQPRMVREEAGITMEQSGVIQMVCEQDGIWKAAMIRVEGTVPVPADEAAAVRGCVIGTGNPQTAANGQQVSGYVDVTLQTVTTAEQGIPMVTGLTLGEKVQPDPQRPSMILRRCGGQALWDVAKASGSTVDQIKQFNQLQGEPEADQLLLIPVL